MPIQVKSKEHRKQKSKFELPNAISIKLTNLFLIGLTFIDDDGACSLFGPEICKAKVCRTKIAPRC